MKRWSLLAPFALLTTLVIAAAPGAAEDIFRETFDQAPAEGLFQNTWGDPAETVQANGAAAGAGVDGGTGAHLQLTFGPKVEHNLSYWTYTLPEPVPIIPPLAEISFRVKANVPVSLKVAIGTFGFIYHAPGTGPTENWTTVSLADAYEELRAWCAKGERDAAQGFVTGIIVAITPPPPPLTKGGQGGVTQEAAKQGGGAADVYVDDIALTGPEGAAALARQEAVLRRTRKVRVSVVAQRWCDEGRTLEAVLEKIDEAARDGADIVALPQECVQTDGEPIPGPISSALAERAKRYGMYVLGNIRETDGGAGTEARPYYVTSFLLDREGNLVGKYRKSHKMPDEDMALGDDLPVFPTDFGPIALRIGTDRFFPDIDHVYTAKGARIIFWAQRPEPVEDEYSQDFPSEGRAADYNVFIACSRYAAGKPGYITNMFPPYCGFPIGRAYVIDREGHRIASTLRTGGGIATATIPLSQWAGGGRGPHHSRAFAVLTAPVQLPEKKQYAKRKIRVTLIEAHLGVEDLLSKLDEAGRMGSDIVCLYEFVWISGGDPKRVEEMTRKAKENLARVAAKAKEYGMYVLIAGVVDRLERNEAIVFGREGQEVGRYFKIAKTHDEQICGDDTPIIETDFGRIAARICADEWMVELDRSYGVKGADILFTPTQSWGPDALLRDRRDISRAMDAQLFLVECTHPSSEVRHRSMIVEPTGVVVARSEYRQQSLVSAVIDLDHDRPQRYVREYTPHTPGGYLPEYQPDQMPKATNDLREVILAQRRPELYGVLAVEEPGAK